MPRRIGAGVLLLACLATVAGCASYYRVTDLSTNKVYYTKKLDRQPGGSVLFKDATTGTLITLQNSQIKPIDKAVFKDNTPNL
jgi:hypothetical protein